VVGLNDVDFRNALDDLLTAATEPSERLMTNVFIDSHISPLQNQPATFGFGAGLFVHHYNNFRNQGHDVETSFSAAQAEVLSHPVIQEFLAAMATQNINRGVTNG
tara:strand:- start:391 stop:705 length:315 start_codon:yes stop_codon:yes gene_type:complete